MNVDELCEKAGWKIAAGDGKKDITSAYIGDLLSWVMSQRTAWHGMDYGSDSRKCTGCCFAS